MKPRKPLFVFSALACTLAAAAQDTTYVDRTRSVTTPDKATNYIVTVKKDSVWQYSNYRINGTLYESGSFTLDSPPLKQGEFTTYNEEGKPLRSVTWVKGKLEGPETFYYPNGQPQMKGPFINGKWTGEWIGYYPDGQVSARAEYNNGKQVVITGYNEDGSVNKTVNVFERSAEFPNGQEALTLFLNNRLRYPAQALRDRIRGTIVVKFKVSKDGKNSDFTVATHIENSLEEEALRVVRSLPNFLPAIKAGIPVDSHVMQPIVFALP